MRSEPADQAEMINQVLYGEHFKVLEIRKKWSRIRLAHDKYEGWVDNKQYKEISEDDYTLAEDRKPILASDLLQMATSSDSHILSLPLGAQLANLDLTGDQYEGNNISSINAKSSFINTALLYLKSPYLWGGRTPFGLDCSGFTQMVYTQWSLPL